MPEKEKTSELHIWCAKLLSFSLLYLLADPGKARGCSTNTVLDYLNNKCIYFLKHILYFNFLNCTLFRLEQLVGLYGFMLLCIWNGGFPIQ